MQDSNNNWLLWDVNINTLVANSTRTLSDINPVTIAQDLSGLPGSHAVFVGHSSSDGNIHYNGTPLSIMVK